MSINLGFFQYSLLHTKIILPCTLNNHPLLNMQVIQKEESCPCPAPCRPQPVYKAQRPKIPDMELPVQAIGASKNIPVLIEEEKVISFRPLMRATAQNI